MEAFPRSPLVPQSNLGPLRMWKRRDDGSPCGAPTSLGKGCAFPTFPHPFYWLKEDISNWFKSGHFYFGLTDRSTLIATVPFDGPVKIY
jgi:hypothetical protein